MSQKIDDMFAADLKDLANPSRVKLAEADKTAVIGPLLELANVGIPSGVGYAIGSNKTPASEGEARRQLDSGYSVGKGLLVPGYTGYRAGKNSAAREALRVADEKKKKGKKEAALSPEMAFNAGRVKGAQDPSKPGAETPENLKAVERMRKNKPSPLTDKIEAAKKQASADELFAAELCQAVGLDVPEAYADFERPQVKIAGSASDAIDNHFRGWMEKKAGEDVVKEAVSRGFIEAMLSGKKIVGKGGRTASQRLMRASDRGQSAFSRRVGVDASKRMTNAALELQSQADKQLNNIGRNIAAGTSKTSSVKTAMCGDDHKKLKPGAKCEKCGEMMKESSVKVPVSKELVKKINRAAYRRMAGTAAVGTVAGAAGGYHLGKKKGQEKKAGVIEHDENLDLLAKIRARAAQGLGLTGDG